MAVTPLEAFVRDGFVRLPGTVPPDLLARLRRGAEPILAMHARGELRDGRRHQTILDPAVYDPSFLEFLNLAGLNERARELIGTEDFFFAELGLLVGSATHDLCRWHRDFSDGDPDLPGMLARPRVVVQFNCALYEDACLWVIPGSHARPTLDPERAWADRFAELGFFDAFDRGAAIDPAVLEGMPGAAHAVLAPGDALLYNPILWHAAEYRPGARRATLHGTWKDARAVDEFKPLRWGFDHNPWLLEPAYLGGLGPHVSRQLPRFQAAMRRHVPAFVNR